MRYEVYEIGSFRYLGSVTADLQPHATVRTLRWLTTQVPVFLNDQPRARPGHDQWIWTRPSDRSRVMALPGFWPSKRR